MKICLIASILFRIAFFCLLIFQLHLKNDLIDNHQRYIDYAMIVFGTIAFYFPLNIWLYVIQFIHCGYLIYSAFGIKKKEMNQLTENDAKDLFVAFFFFFSGLFQEGKFQTEFFYKVIQQFQFFFLHVIDIILLALSLFLSCVYDAILKGRIEVYPKPKTTDSTQQPSSKESTKKKVD